MVDLFRSESETGEPASPLESPSAAGEGSAPASDGRDRRAAEAPAARAAEPPRVAPLPAALLGWLVVALWNVGDITRLPMRPNGGAARAAHYVVDFGHVLGVALAVAAGVALWTRLGPRRWYWNALAVAVVVGALSPIVLSRDLAGALERLFPNITGAWFLPSVCVAVGQVVTASFLAGRLCARPRLRWLGAALGVAFVAANDFVLENGYPGAHVLLSASGATLIGASLAGTSAARLGALGVRLGVRRGGPVTSEAKPAGGWRRWLRPALRPASLLWGLGVAFAAFTIVREPSSAVQIELLQRDTPLLFRWLRTLYAPSKVGGVEIPSELRHWYEPRWDRPDIPPPTKRLVSEPPIVIVITIDALRADLLEPKYRHVAPNLHEMRASSVYFTQARSSGSDTRFSLATLFSGRHYSMLNWTRSRSGRRPTLKDDLRPRLPELLSKAGVQTVVGMTVSMVEPKEGIARGFTEELRERPGVKYRTHGDEITDLIIERLRRHGPEPLFIYTHLLEPHDPYDTYGKPAKSKFDAYLIEVSVADENVGRIRRAVAELGLKRRTVFVIGADHGEGFGEHRIHTHGKALYDVLVHVPLMIEAPGVAPRTVDDFVMLMDIGPTVLDIFGVPTPGEWVSETLTPFLRGRRGDPSRVLLMEKYSHKAMLFPDGLKVMKRRSAYELYDVLRDPEEKENLWDARSEEGKRRLGLLEAYVEAHSRAETDERDGDE